MAGLGWVFHFKLSNFISLGYNTGHKTVRGCPECPFAFLFLNLFDNSENSSSMLFYSGVAYRLSPWSAGIDTIRAYRCYRCVA